MVSIANLELKNYKSLRRVSLEMRPLNILIGPNGSGKSNLISFFNLMREAANQNLQNQLNAMGGIHQVKYYTSDLFEETLDWEITFRDFREVERKDDTGEERGIGYYKGKLGRRGSNDYSIRLEEIERPPFRTHSDERRYIYLNVSEGHIRILKSRSDETESPYEVSDQELVIAQLRDRNRYPVLFELRNLMADWTIFRGFGADALQNIHTSQLFSNVEPLRLDPLGRNLVSVLQKLGNEPKYSDVYDELMQTLQAAFPDLGKIDTPVTAGGMGALYYRSRVFPTTSIPASSMSDGYLRFLGLAILLLLPEPPSLVAIDEPEIGLHPKLIPLLAELLKDASSRTQIVVTTHSPELINAEAIDVSDIVLVEREYGETTFSRPNVEGLKRWLERYSLGNLWLMGKLEH